jgi:hypothetical protein
MNFNELLIIFFLDNHSNLNNLNNIKKNYLN